MLCIRVGHLEVGDGVARRALLAAVGILSLIINCGDGELLIVADRIPNREIVVYVLSLMGGESRKVHTEDIAKKCYEMFPDSFSWTKYPQYPDKEVARHALVDARKGPRGPLVTGRAGRYRGQSTRANPLRARDGWQLTERGIEWVRNNNTRLEQAVGSWKPKEHRQRILRQLSRVRQHKTFQGYLSDQDSFSPSVGELADLLRCRVDAESRVWRKRIEALKGKARLVGQSDVLEFLDTCECDLPIETD